MSQSPADAPVGIGSDVPIFLLITAPEGAHSARSRPPVRVFTSEGVAREAFLRLRLEVEPDPVSTWAQLVAVKDDVIRPLCWFGCSPEPHLAPRRRTKHALRRWSRR